MSETNVMGSLSSGKNDMEKAEFHLRKTISSCY